MFECDVGNCNALFKNNNGGQGEIFITTRPNLTVDPIFFSVLDSIYTIAIVRYFSRDVVAALMYRKDSKICLEAASGANYRFRRCFTIPCFEFLIFI